MSGEGARARRDSGITLQVSKKTLVALATVVLAASGGAYYKSDQAQTAADAGQAVAVQAETKTAAVHQVGVTRAVAQETDLTRLVRAHNELVAEVKRLRKACAPKTKKAKTAEPALAPVVLTPKAPLPATPEAAAAAVTK